MFIWKREEILIKEAAAEKGGSAAAKAVPLGEWALDAGRDSPQ